MDGFGDFVSTSWAIGRGSRLLALDRIHFPHLLGLLYLAVTQYLGFPRYGDEQKVMGLAAYGEPATGARVGSLSPEGAIYLGALRESGGHGGPASWPRSDQEKPGAGNRSQG